MKGLNSYPNWVRYSVACALLAAAVLTYSWQGALSFMLLIMGVGLILPSPEKPSA